MSDRIPELKKLLGEQKGSLAFLKEGLHYWRHEWPSVSGNKPIERAAFDGLLLAVFLLIDTHEDIMTETLNVIGQLGGNPDRNV